MLDLTPSSAIRLVNPEGVELEVSGRDVLCLAASGGQQTAAFGLLGARVSVFDLSENQLAQDAAVARHYGFPITLQQGDMRDLGVYADRSFDIVWQAHGINFVPDAKPVIREVARLLRPGGLYRLQITNPYAHGVWQRWNGHGYEVTQAYVDGGEIEYRKTEWTIETPEGELRAILGPREFRHSLETIVNTLLDCRLRLLGLWEQSEPPAPDEVNEPGSWLHFKSRMPPWITLWAVQKATLSQPLVSQSDLL
jgi:SAM-dependent methyltransferase